MKRKRHIKYPATVFLIACYDPRGLSAISEQITSWVTNSRFRIRVINLHKTFPEYGMRIPDSHMVTDAASIIIHPTACYSPSNLLNLCKSLDIKRKIGTTSIVLYKQDEHVQSHMTAEIIGKYGIDIVLTCTSVHNRTKVYPPEMVGNAVFMKVYTGYISDKLLKNAPQKMWRERKIDFFYRGSKQPPEIGKLGFLKYAFARRLINACRSRGLSCDASSEWTDRILGFDWLISLSNSRSTVSLESGSNCFDFNGEIKIAVDKFLKENPSIDPWSDNGFKKLTSSILHKYEGNVNYGQIAPRHLEAVVTFTPQLLLPGNYSGVFQAGRHYIEINQDLDNFDEAIELLNDDDYRTQMLQCAYEEIALNPALQFQNFVQMVDDLIESRHITSIGDSKSYTHASFRRINEASENEQVVVLCPHKAHLDPRIRWWSQHTSAKWNVHIIEIDNKVTKPGGKENSAKILLSAREFGLNIQDLPNEVIDSGNVSFAIEILCRVSEQLNRLRYSRELSRHYSSDHIWLMDHLIRISIGLIEAGVRINGTDLLIAIDLPALLAGLCLCELYGVPLIYDAHEIWSHSNLNLEWHEIEWWNQLERRLLRDVDIPVTVSPGIGQWYHREMNKEMLVVPNYSPLSDSIGQSEPKAIDDTVRFLFLGAFADNRGIEELIQAWDFDPDIATLTLQGPHSEHRDKCKKFSMSLGRGERGVRFAPPVSENELIAEASKYHVGIIPYTYSYPYSHCCPNKLSQYMAAGCAILSNKLPFVEKCISDANCGVSVNFNSQQQIYEKIKEIINDKDKIELWRINSLRAVEYYFNWESASKAVLDKLRTFESFPRENFGISLFPPYEVYQTKNTSDLTISAYRNILNKNNYFRIVSFVEARLKKTSFAYKFGREVNRMIRKLLKVW